MIWRLEGLHYPPPFQGPSVSVSSKQGFPGKTVPVAPTGPYFESFAHTYIRSWRLRKCSTIRPLPRATFFGFWHTRLFWRALTSSSHQNLILGHLLTPTERSRDFKSAQPSVPSQEPTVADPSTQAFFERPRPVARIRTFFWSLAYTHIEIWRLRRCSTIRPLPGAPLYQFLANKALLESRDR